MRYHSIDTIYPIDSVHIRTTMRKIIVLLFSLLSAGTALAAAPSPVIRAEVAHLLDYLTQSGCEFQRNGSWHAAAEARSHLQRKYGYLVKRGLVKQTEDFIEHGASRSSLSGKPYQVKCDGNATRTSAQWLREELQRHRQNKKDAP